ncbi:hypothetical protein D3C78_1577690 [compost metagenome]
MPDAFHGREQHLILRGARQHQVEHFIIVLAVIVGGNRALLLFNNTAQIIDIRACRHFGRKSGNIALKQLTRL